MVVLFLITGLAVGGAENQVQEIALRLSARRWKVAVVSMLTPTVRTQRLTTSGVHVEDLAMVRGSADLRAVVRLRRVIQRLRPALVHSHMVHANLLARVTRPVSRIPVLVCTSHASGLEGRGKETFLRLTDRLADKTTHVSRIGLDNYLAKGIVAPHRAVWIPNGVDLRQFGGSGGNSVISRRGLGVPDNCFLWLAVGVFRPMKAFDQLIRAFSDLPENARLLLVGDGPQRQQIAGVIEELALQERVTLLGIRDDVSALMTAADAFVLSSDAGEALPIVLLEAAASNLPIVTTDVGGCKEIVEDGVNGIVVPLSDSRALARAMREVMALPDAKRRSMGGQGRARAMEQFDIERVVTRWEDLYRELLSRPPR